MKKLIFIVGMLAVIAVLGYFWFSREPSTDLVDASGQALTAGNPLAAEEETSGDSLFSSVRALMEAREFATAKAELMRLIETSDRDGEACILLCDVTRELKENEAAVDYGLKAVELLPESAEAHLAYARALGAEMAGGMRSLSGMFKAMTKISRFKEAARRVIELDPEDTEARSMLVFTNLAPAPIGDLDRGFELCGEIEERDPVLGKQMRIICLRRKEALDEARALCLESIEAYPEERGFRLSLANIHSEEERFEEADTAFEAARDGEKDDVYYRSLYYQALMRVNHAFDAERAVHLLDEFIAAEPWGDGMPDLIYAHLRRGNALEQIKRYPEARAAYEACLQLDPGFEAAEDALEALSELTG